VWQYLCAGVARIAAHVEDHGSSLRDLVELRLHLGPLRAREIDVPHAGLHLGDRLRPHLANRLAPFTGQLDLQGAGGSLDVEGHPAAFGTGE
jgi:hypothetical protein